MRWFALSLLFVCAAPVVSAQHIDHRNRPVRPRIDVIPPLGNNLPPSYRRTYNRPTNLGGRIAYWIAPSSQEAMAWQRARQAGAYRNHLPRLERHFFYRKPWEALQVGPRTPSNPPPLEQESATDQRSTDRRLADQRPTDQRLTEQRLTEQGPERKPVIVYPLERETAADHERFGDDFGSIVLVNPAGFAFDPDSDDQNSAEPSSDTASEGVTSDGEPHETLRRLQEENRRLKEVRGR